MFRSTSKAFFLLACSVFVSAAQARATPPKELVQYIRDAQKAGQSVFQIQQNAVDSGWPVATVTEAITYVQDEDAAEKKTAAVSQPAMTPTANSSLVAKPSLVAEPEAAAADKGVSAVAPSPAGVGSPAPKAPATGGVVKPAETGGVAKPAETIGAKPEKVSRGVPDDYQIGAGDVLDVNVWKEPDASVKGAMVRTDGKISMPLLKEVDVIGLTPIQLEKHITDQLLSGGLINTPDVTIIVTGTGSKKIYVQGKVKKEGPIPFNYRMTVMQALSEAGGLTDYAKKNKIYILRTEDGKTFKLPFDYAAVLKGQHLELNILLQASDMIVVP